MAKQFIAYVEQAAEGCDYTIGCGRTLWRLEATSKAEAVEELREEVLGEWRQEIGDFQGGHWFESTLAELRLFEIVDEKAIPLDKWYTEARELISNAAKQSKEKEEKEQWERLKRKYG